MNKKTLCLVLLLSFALLLSACGGTTTATTMATTAAAGTTAADGTTAAPTPKPEPVELTIAFLITGSAPADQALVEEEINKITLEKINAKVKLIPLNFGAAMQQYNLMLSSNEKLDLMITFPYTYNSLVAQNRIQEIGGLIDQYAPAVKDASGKFYNNGLVGGQIYGVSPITEGAGGAGLCIRKDILDKYNIDPAIISNEGLDGIEKVFKTIKQNEPNASIMSYSNQNMGLGEAYFQIKEIDKLADTFGVLMNRGADLKVVNLYETQEYADFVKKMRSWYESGYIMENIATAKEDQHSLMKAGKSYAYFTATKPGIAQQESAQNGYECIVPEFGKPFASTNPVFLWVVPNACQKPDVAVQMLNLMFTDPALENLMSWGIEGKHYVDKGDGTVGFPDGTTAETSGYFLNTPWMMGNMLLTHVWQGNPANLWDITLEHRANADVSKAMGFAYDPSNVKNEVTELTNIYTQYKMALESGVVDPNELLPEMIDKMNKAGIAKVVAEKQKQLDEWATLNNIK